METLDMLFKSVIGWVDTVISWFNNYLNDDSKENYILVLIGLFLMANLKNWGVKANIKN